MALPRPCICMMKMLEYHDKLQAGGNVKLWCQWTMERSVIILMHYEEQEGHPLEAGNDLYQEADNNDYEDVGNDRYEDDVDDVDIFYDAELPDEPNPDNQLLYEGAPLSKGQSTLLIMAYAIRHNLTQVATQDLLRLINEHLPIPSVPLSSYHLRKECIFDLGREDIVYHAYCQNCFAYLGTDEDLSCECCGQITTKAKNIKDGLFFVNISLSSQLKHLLETPSITAKLQPHEQEDEDDSIGDAMDGSVYKKLARDIVEVDDLSLTFNCDGISAFHSSNASVWQILCTINELPPKERKRHVLMAGIWF
ncbi:hypothetical protein BSL78_27028 [Apostichopus japonicus]|uniref:Uncharacterized protein n=1 Tax=Stichopus japonicus TaxID=307972 RepID=A0A2G8JK97_STIJA|nr:hypothetical protein BSL78_27028 [Apostichopus japonicus]